MDSQYLETLTAVGAPHSACPTLSTVHIGIDGASIAFAYAEFIGWSKDYGAGQFVPEHPGIYVGRMFARKGVKIRAAHTNAFHSNERLSGAGGWLLDIPFGKIARTSQNNLLHVRHHWFSLSEVTGLWHRAMLTVNRIHAAGLSLHVELKVRPI
jgi:hypothetical protein